MIFIALLSLLSFAVGFELTIKPTNEVQIKAEGARVVFTCEAPGVGASDDDSSIVFEWVAANGDVIAETTERRYVEASRRGSKLYITKIVKEDAGTYTCRATYREEEKERSVRLELYEAIKFVDKQENQYPEIHTDALIHCKVTGNPAPVVSWKHEGNRLDPAPGGRYEMLEDGLRIKNITQEDNGVYICRGEVDEEGRYDHLRIKVEVHIRPKLVTELQDIERKEGDNVSILCKADGLPSPTYKFFKGDVELTSSASVVVDSTKGTLNFSPLDKSDEGGYRCEAVNDVGSVSSSANIKVLVPPHIEDFTDIELAEGETLTVLCESRGDPRPEMAFMKNGKRLGENNEIEDEEDDDEEDADDNIEVLDEGDGKLKLVIDNVAKNHAGKYTCTSSNTVGKDEQSVVITVHYKPTFSEADSHLVYSWAGAQHNLTCTAYGLPRPSVRWEKDGVHVTTNTNYRIIESHTENSTISNLQISLKEENINTLISKGYICDASNLVGSAVSEPYELRRAMPPHVPADVSFVKVMADGVIVEVSEPIENGGIPIIGYSIEYSEGQNMKESLVHEEEGEGEAVGKVVGEHRPLTSPKNSYFTGNKTTIKGLRPITDYIIKVKAKNQVGFGPELTEGFKTANLGPPGEIKILSAPRGIDGRTYELEWELVDSGGLPALEYEFKYSKVRPNSNEITEWKVATHKVKPDETKYKLSDLTPLSTYMVKVKARNSQGWSPETAPFKFTTVEASAVHGSAAPLSSAAVLLTLSALALLQLTLHTL